jgi:hypothetical protein
MVYVLCDGYICRLTVLFLSRIFFISFQFILHAVCNSEVPIEDSFNQFFYEQYYTINTI